MAPARHIQVILPLKLEWEPFYALPADCPDLQIGDRVAVPFASRSYLAVVSATGVTPTEETLEREKEIYGLRETKARILPSEIEFWRLVATYYMCSVGEVYKAAYPSVKDESVTARKKEKPFVPMADLPDDTSELFMRARAALGKGKPLIINSNDDVSLLLSFCRDEAMCGGNVLWLVPELKFSKALETRLRVALGSRLLVWGSDVTPARKREVTRTLRSGDPYVVLGTRSALFLPHRNLTLVVVQDEFDTSYKQSSPAPRYNARDAAVLLSSVFGARTVLSAGIPSLESQYNCLGGKYILISDNVRTNAAFNIVDTRSEMRKRGMIGDVSRKLIEEVSAIGVEHAFFYKARRAAFPKTEELAGQLHSLLGEKAFLSDDYLINPPTGETRLLAVFGIDALLGRSDFRADERAMQTLMGAAAACGRSLEKVLIQTREPSHALFRSLTSGEMTALLEERRNFSLPPFTRLVDILIQDPFPDRAARTSSALAAILQNLGIGDVMPCPDRVRVALPRNKELQQSKLILAREVEAFVKREHYSGHLAFDVDPVS